MNDEHANRPDFYLLGAVFVLIFLGVLILSSASASLSQSKFQDTYYLLYHQLTHGIIPGFFLGLLAYKISLDFLRKSAPLLLFASIVLLVLIFIPGIGFESGGAQRWVHLGFTSIQPSEILKLTFIVYLASWLASRTSQKTGKQSESGLTNTFAAFAIIMALVGLLLLLQPDLSTFGIIALTGLGMFFLSGTPLKYTAITLGGGIALLLLLVIIEPYRIQRFLAWLSPEADPMGKSFQSSQALILVGSGGPFGQGLGSSSSKFTLLPELIGDSIFAPFSQELGFLGGFILISVLIFFAWRSFLIARQSRTKFEYLCALGIVIWIALQAAVNLASTMRLIPLSGVPLPFISYGGTAIAMELAAAGVLLNISKQKMAAISH